MSKGFTLIEMVLTVIIVSILSAFSFSVIWQYSGLYADAQGGYIYSEAAAALERITRELRDASNVDTLSPNPASYINFQLTHGTPGVAPSTPNWVQYCTCSSGGRTLLYRVVTGQFGQGATNKCAGTCPALGVLMSRNIVAGGFQVRGFWGNGTQNNPGPESDSYEITLRAAGGSSIANPSIRLVSRATPRNYCRYTSSTCSTGGLNGFERAFDGGYYDEIK